MTTRKNIRFISSLLAVCMLTAAAAGCAEKADDTPAAADTQAIVTEVQEEENLDLLTQRKNVRDDLPDYDAQGSTFLITINGRLDDYIMEEASGDVVDDAVYARNQTVSERFNTNIDVAFNSDGNYPQVTAYVLKNVNSADDACDLVSHHVVDLGSLVLSNVFFNWNNLEYTNFEKPWWSKSTVEDLTYAGKTLIAVGDYALSAITNTYCVYYNKVLGANYNVPNIFDIINAGQWTIDKQIELTKDIYEDLNSDGKKDFDDLYGFASDASSNVNVYLWAFENPIIAKNQEGELEFAINTPRMPDIITKIVEMFDEPGAFTYKDNAHHGSGVDQFYNNHAVFANGFFNNATDKFRDFESDYSMIPYPKWTEEQKYYHTQVDGSHHALAITTCETELERVSIITEALNAESYKQVVPAYYDVALKVKGTRDDESIAILDMLIENRVFDFGYVYDCWKGASFWVQEMVQARKTDWASYYERKQKSVSKQYAKVIEYFEQLDG